MINKEICKHCGREIDLEKDFWASNLDTNEISCFDCSQRIAGEEIEKQYSEAVAKIEPYMRQCECGISGYSEDPRWDKEEYKCFDCRRKEGDPTMPPIPTSEEAEEYINRIMEERDASR